MNNGFQSIFHSNNAKKLHQNVHRLETFIFSLHFYDDFQLT